MYSLITEHIDALLESFSPRYIEEYRELLENLEQQIERHEYRDRYVQIWRLQRLGFGDRHWDLYFARMRRLLRNAPAGPDDWDSALRALAQELHEIPRRRGTPVLAFAACTKLAHMVDQRLPIYDSKIAAFYLWQPPAPSESFDVRIERYLEFYKGLRCEQRRILRDGVLRRAVSQFRRRFDARARDCTNEKIIDFLIWHWVGRCQDNGLAGGQIRYH
jgi:hypothetical protein